MTFAIPVQRGIAEVMRHGFKTCTGLIFTTTYVVFKTAIIYYFIIFINIRR